MSYTVTLHDAPNVTVAARDEAQKRFRHRLEKHYGSPQQVASAYCDWNIVNESHGQGASEKRRAAAAEFAHFMQVARKVGIKGLEDAELAYFAIKLTPAMVLL